MVAGFGREERQINCIALQRSDPVCECPLQPAFTKPQHVANPLTVSKADVADTLLDPV